MPNDQVMLSNDSDLATVMQYFGTLLETIPEPNDDALDGAGILVDILNAKSANELVGDSSELPSVDQIAEQYPRKIWVIGRDVIRRPSEIQGSLPYYVIASLTDPDTGRTFRVNTSSAQPLAKLCRLFQFDALPAKVSFDHAKKATKAGYFPVNMTIHEHSVA